MGYTHDEPLTANEIRSQRWYDYKDNICDGDTTMRYNEFTIEFVCDLWDIELELVK